MQVKLSFKFFGLLLAAAVWSTAAQAGLGLSTVVALGDDHPVTVYHPSSAPEQPVPRGRFVLNLAVDGPVLPGNGRLVVISHGSGGGPWVHEQLARQLVAAGFVVAMPRHRGDSVGDDGNPGPDSWVQRPAEVSRAIDAVSRDPRFAPHLRLDRVGVYGFSAGGHTALSLAGGRWAKTGFRDHCELNLAADFQTCVGLITRLTGGALDGLKQWVARRVIRARFDDPTVQAHHDPRVAAVIASGPLAADFDMTSFASPGVPLGLVTLGQDRWLVPRFHSDRVLAACSRCEHIAHMADAGHGAMLSPLPPGLTGWVGDLLNDPPGFDRTVLRGVDQKMVDFFVRHLMSPAAQAGAPARAALGAESQ